MKVKEVFIFFIFRPRGRPHCWLRCLSFLLQKIKRELLDSQQKVSSLQELSAQLLVNTKPLTLLLQSQASELTQGSECLEAQEKVHVILNRLRLLLRSVGSDLEELERRLETTGSRQVRGMLDAERESEEEEQQPPPPRLEHLCGDVNMRVTVVVLLHFSGLRTVVACWQTRTLWIRRSRVRGDCAKSQAIGNVPPRNAPPPLLAPVLHQKRQNNISNLLFIDDKHVSLFQLLCWRVYGQSLCCPSPNSPFLRCFCCPHHVYLPKVYKKTWLFVSLVETVKTVKILCNSLVQVSFLNSCMQNISLFLFYNYVTND